MTAEPLGVTSPSMSPGQLVGGRFRVDSVATEDALGTVLAAVDQKTQKAVALRVVRPELFASQEAINTLRQECRQAASVAHRCLLSTYGVGSAGGGSQYVACEWAAGTTLTDLVARHRDRRDPMTLRGIYHVLAQVCAALDASHRTMAHGAVRPSVVWVDGKGNAKLGDLGVAKAVLASRGAAAFGASEQAYLAPEIKAGGAPSIASDVFGLGAVLYEMLTMRSPAEGFTPPSQAHPEATEAIDRHLLRALSADPATRFATPREMVEGLSPLIAHGRDSSPQADFEGARAAAPQAVPSPVPRPQANNDGPAVGMRVSVHEPFRESAVSEVAAPVAAAPVDLKSLLAKITENDAPRWMVVKDKLDHGPFSGRELVELILKGDVREDHGLLNMDTGERKEVKGFPEFKEFLEQFKLREKQKQERAAVKRSEKVETASNTVKIVIGVAIVGVIAAVATILLVTLQAADEAPEETLNARADLYERGDLQIEGTVGILPAPRRRGGGGGGGGGGAPRAGGSSGGNLSYEEAMNQAANLGDATQSGGERQLTSGDVAGVMNRHINSFFGCVGAELRRGSNLSNVEIDLAIAGSGQVIGASTRQGSPAFKSCIAGRVRSIRFPAFPAPRMGARFRFSVN
jgi:serine/threonine protein kinase